MTRTRPTWLEIDLAALQRNYAEIRKAVGDETEIMAVVKADAYGHGVQRVAPALAEAGAEQFGVAMAGEGMELRDIGITQPIVILGGAFPGEEELFPKYDLQPVVYHASSAIALNEAARLAGQPVKFHLKVDTGMGRLGFRPESLDETLDVLSDLPHLEMVGVMSHLAVADEPHRPFTSEQFECFHAALEKVLTAGFSPRYRHIANSAAIFTRDLAGCNLVRPGISLYGGLTTEDFVDRVAQAPVMRLVSRIGQIKDVPSGEGISYGHRFITSRPSRLATIPIGYADGYNRLLTNCGEALIHGQRVPVVGTVCMDWILIDVTDLPEAQLGDQVVLLGADGNDCITAQEWADKVDSITYEVFCRMTRRLPRVYKAETGEQG